MQLKDIIGLKAQSPEAVENFLHLERFVNSPKGNWSDYSEVSLKFSPESDIKSFEVPILEFEKTEIQIIESNPSAEVISQISPDGLFQFFIHPYIISPETELLSYRTGAPTSSTRTILIESDCPRFMVKTDLDRRHFRFRRRLKAGSVRHSLRMNTELESVAGSGNLHRYAVLPESIGIIASIEGRESGMIVRELLPRPRVPDDRFLIPYFSLYSKDPKFEGDAPLLVQIVESNASNNHLDYFLENIVGPIQDAWAALVSERGILPELHGQNALLEVDKQGRPVRVVHRDFQSIYTDEETRREKGFEQYEKHIAGREDGITKKSQYSLVYDHFITGYLISRLAKCFISHFCEYSEKKVSEKIRDRFRSIPYNDISVFPDTVHGFGSAEMKDNEVTVVNKNIEPTYR